MGELKQTTLGIVQSGTRDGGDGGTIWSQSMLTFVQSRTRGGWEWRSLEPQGVKAERGLEPERVGGCMVWKQRQEATPVIEKPAMELVSRSGWNQLEVQSGGVGRAKWLLGRLKEKSWGVEEGAVRQLSLAQRSPFPLTPTMRGGDQSPTFL